MRLLFYNLLDKGGGGGGGGGGWLRWIHLKVDVEGQVGGKLLDVDGHGGWETLKIREFSWSHMCNALFSF